MSKLIKDLPQTTKTLMEVEELKLKYAKELKSKIVDSSQVKQEAFHNDAITHLMQAVLGLLKFYYLCNNDGEKANNRQLEHIVKDMHKRVDQISTCFKVQSNSHAITQKPLKMQESTMDSELTHLERANLKSTKDGMFKLHTDTL